MPELKLKQLVYECNSWKRLLAFMREENIHHKTRLAEILKDTFNKNLLEEAENFQSRFIKEDEIINVLRDDIAELDKLLGKEFFEDGKSAREIERKLKRLRNNMFVAEQQFDKLQEAFNNYLVENI
jgi:hypothetical protein